MPFTPSHAVVALPFIRTPLVPAAIGIGAMTPDLPLFLRGFGVDYVFTHTFAHVLWTAGLAFVLFLVWRVVMRPAVRQLAPRWLAERLPDAWDEGGPAAAGRAVGIGERRGYPILLAVSLIAGVLSHITWDLFTHEARWGVKVLPVLDTMWGPLAGYKWLQHGSSVIGLLILGIWALLWLRRRSPDAEVLRRLPGWTRVAWWISLPAVLVAAWIFGLSMLGPLSAEFTAQHLAYRVLPPACAAWGVLTLVLCLVVAFPRRGTPHQRG